MLKRLLILLFTVVFHSALLATEGMWLPLLLAQLNETEMQEMGMKMTAEDIYSVNQGSLKDAIVHFGGFCTGEVISDQGLVLTNHHCGMGSIRSHSTLENNYLENGFWAAEKSAEFPNPGLFVTFIVRIEDVTEAALEDITADLPEKLRQSRIDQNINKIKEAAERESYQEVMVRAFYHGNQYFMFVTETYRDVRLVGAPPNAIGKFGADTDNWVWPRHTGDFSLFRIYADKDNKPAEYSPDNVPYQPRHSLPISLDGVEEDDFTLVFGFPGRTSQYLPAAAVEMTVDVLNPARIGVRDRTLAIMDAAMKADPKVRLQYASKQSSLANSWKRWIGEIQGIERTDALNKKRIMEAEFQQRVNEKAEWKEQYGQLLPRLEQLYRELQPYALNREYVNEIAGRNVELFRLANTLHRFVRMYESSGIGMLADRKDQLVQYFKEYYADYRAEIDQQVLAEQMELYFQKLDPDFISPYAVEQINLAGKDYNKLAKDLFIKSMLAHPDQLIGAMEEDLAGALEKVREDVAYDLARHMVEQNEGLVVPKYNALEEEIQLLQRTYMKALMEVFPEQRFYPDANSTLRITYGKVKGYQARDAVRYETQTYLDGVMEKYVPGDYEFDVPVKLQELYDKKDYGPYGEAGKMPVCFIGTNHTTGGNSGSPAIDAYGNLVGLNFDRAWEGVMSDLHYDASICRNIMVDIRYVLFIVDKLGGAKHLIEEMELVHPKG